MRKYIKNTTYFKLTCITILLTAAFWYWGYVYFIPCQDKVRINELEELPYTVFYEDVTHHLVNTVYFTSSSEYMFVELTSGRYYKVSNPDHEGFKKFLLESGIIVKKPTNLVTAENVEDTRKIYITLISFVFVGSCLYFLYKAFVSSPCEERMIHVKGKKKAYSTRPDASPSSAADKKNTHPEIGRKTFSDIAGLTEVKKDMACIVDFLINKEKYENAGAKLPKGIILYGPPGTGKTLLAKAVAGEAEVPFLYMSGSEFVELYVGVGAKRVRELFARARRQSPCIIFIDEIDAVGGNRGAIDTNGEDRKTINALLTEMDGFKPTENIIVIGATNRLEDLDPALTRPGRFTNKYCVPLPETIEERMEIIRLYSRNKRLNESVDIRALARETVGFSPAMIEALLNEASIISVQEESAWITREILDKAMYKMLLQGHMREDKGKREEEELHLVAWHEAGHAIIGHLLGKEISKVTIVPSTSGAGGVTFSSPPKTNLYSKEKIKGEVMELYGGRLAELLFYEGDHSRITTGASNDIEQATKRIRRYITKYGMSEEFGLLNLEQAKMDNEKIVKAQIALAKEWENEALRLLKKNRVYLEALASLLLEHNTVYQKDIEQVFITTGNEQTG